MMAFQFSGQSVFKSLNKAKLAIFFSLLRKAIIVVPLTLLLPHLGGLGVNGVFLAEPISNLIGGLACYITMRCTVMPELSAMELHPVKGPCGVFPLSVRPKTFSTEKKHCKHKKRRMAIAIRRFLAYV